MNDTTALERFKWFLLLDLTYEDYQSLWEQPWMTDQGPRVEKAIRQLHRDGLIYLFRVTGPGMINVSGDDPTLRLSFSEVERALARGQRTDWLQEPEDRDLPDIWIGPTTRGEATAKDAPEEILKLYQA